MLSNKQELIENNVEQAREMYFQEYGIDIFEFSEELQYILVMASIIGPARALKEFLKVQAEKLISS